VPDGVVAGCGLGRDIGPPIPRLELCALHAITTRGSICGKGLVVSLRCAVPSTIGRMQSNMIPAPISAPLGIKPACLQAAAI
jgi:hypothetical protein